MMKKTMYTFGILALLVGAGCNHLCAQTNWDYLEKPETPEWEVQKSRKAALAACQIPEGVLRTLPTKHLVQLCLNYPLYFEFYMYNSLQQGLTQNIARNFNGVQELFRRTDCAQCLLDVVQSDDIVNIQALEHITTTERIGELIVRNSIAETLLAHESVMAHASAEQLKEIAAVAARNMGIKTQQPHLYSDYGLGASAYLLGTTLKKGNGGASLSPDLEKFLQGRSLQHVTLLVEELMNNYAKF